MSQWASHGQNYCFTEYLGLMATCRRLHSNRSRPAAKHRPPDASAELGPIDSETGDFLGRFVKSLAAVSGNGMGFCFVSRKLAISGRHDMRLADRPTRRRRAHRRLRYVFQSSPDISITAVVSSSISLIGASLLNLSSACHVRCHLYCPPRPGALCGQASSAFPMAKVHEDHRSHNGPNCLREV